jgi:DNA polymerase
LLEQQLPVGRLRGRWYYYEPHHIPVRVTYHPSYYLRTPKQKASGWDDLQEIARALHTIENKS